MSFEPAGPLRRFTDRGRRAGTPQAAFDRARGFETLADLVADLVAATELIPRDRLAAVRGRAGAGSLAEALQAEGLAQPDGIARSLARRFGLPFIDLAEDRVSPSAADLIPLKTLQRVVAVPLSRTGERMRVAVADPGNIQGIDELRLATRYQLEIGVASRDDILVELERIARRSEVLETQSAMDDFEVVEDDDDLEVDDGVSDAPLVRLVNSIVMQAAVDGASDIHFEPQEDALLVRVRIDGVLTEAQRIPKRMANGVTTRLKVLAKLDIAERRKPQDGRISLNARAVGRMLDIRVAVLPTVEGEQVVMRLIDKSRKTPTLESLGLSEAMRGKLSEIIRRPTGALLVTGPTGSGKSTTLYAALAEINRPEINIITVEDPVEYRLHGVNQVQINVKADMTFAAALRSILRSDPDVIMVGEIRDAETAKMAIESALTGHFVLSTLHTNDAPGALTRLNEMGVEPFLTGSAVSAVLAQRLARRLCANCCEMYAPTAEELMAARISPDMAAAREGMVLYRKAGCPRCNRTGYKGRVGIFQLLVMDDQLEALASQNAHREEIERAAAAAGMRSLWDDGIAKAAAGLTSLEELARVVATF
ncbi:Type II secretory pathway ATPase PulE/Tfp pilus assembly pathway [Gaiella occulta]|uniref:Type II secretory pathway ATPase PulE/Tfp pilus assembly pathway n=1 Tax=Gaiella occulta TaxID=1002870 RepID=A0A7M2YVS4_9ACTN|nr:GspE/PulE family protein [Gaiella occulta]RDI73567.1 Type II secretory pathway ATPase PulE/Tfp pilus assembly pathway [Gaiella occulta]